MSKDKTPVFRYYAKQKKAIAILVVIKKLGKNNKTRNNICSQNCSQFT